MDWICFNWFEASTDLIILSRITADSHMASWCYKYFKHHWIFWVIRVWWQDCLNCSVGQSESLPLLWALFGTGYFSCHLQNELEQDTQRWKILSSTSKLADQVLCLITGRRWNGTAPQEGQLHVHWPFDPEILSPGSCSTNAVGKQM